MWYEHRYGHIIAFQQVSIAVRIALSIADTIAASIATGIADRIAASIAMGIL